MSDPNAARLLLRRAKASEREGGRWFITHDGPDPGPLGRIATSTGRVGHLTELQFDSISLHYAVENKHVRLNATWREWWVKIISRAIDHRKEPVLRIDPSNKPGSFVHNGFRYKLPVMHVITEDRHKWLLECERRISALEQQPHPAPDGQ